MGGKDTTFWETAATDLDGGTNLQALEGKGGVLARAGGNDAIPGVGDISVLAVANDVFGLGRPAAIFSGFNGVPQGQFFR